MICCARFLRMTVVVAGLLGATQALLAQPQNLAVGKPQAIAPGSHGSVASRFVPNLAALRKGGGEFSLALPDGQTVILQRVLLEDRGNGDFFWRGKVLQDEGSLVGLTVKNGVMIGRIWTGWRNVRGAHGAGRSGHRAPQTHVDALRRSARPAAHPARHPPAPADAPRLQPPERFASPAIEPGAGPMRRWTSRRRSTSWSSTRRPSGGRGRPGRGGGRDPGERRPRQSRVRATAVCRPVPAGSRGAGASSIFPPTRSARPD